MKDSLFDEAMDYVQSPDFARYLSRLVIVETSKIDGFDDLPEQLRRAIDRCAAQLYGAGFVRGARWGDSH